MTVQTVLIFGAGGHASVVADAVLAAGERRLIGFVDDNEERVGASLLGHAVVGSIQMALDGHIAFDRYIVGIGDNRIRSKVFALAHARGLQPLTVVHPSAVISPSAVIGAGSLLCAGSVVNPGSSLGANVIVNTRSSLDHHVHVADHAHVAPGATLGGGVTVATGALVGIGSTILPQCAVGSWSTVAGGAVVIDSVGSDATVAGVPARPLGQP